MITLVHNIVLFVYKHFFVLHQNINGLINESNALFVNLQELSMSKKPIDVICVTEHNMKKGDEAPHVLAAHSCS
jgi:hypothetical protein